MGALFFDLTTLEFPVVLTLVSSMELFNGQETPFEANMEGLVGKN